MLDSFNVKFLNEDEKFALFYGIMLGDGCLSYYKTKQGIDKFTLAITGGIDDKLFYENVLSPILISLGRKSVTIKIKKECRGIEINFPNKVIFDKIHSYGFPIGKKGPNIVIPRYFYDQKLVKFVVAGFIATDGSLVLTKNPNKYYPRIEANGISKVLIAQIHAFLISLGMNGGFYLAKRKKFTSQFKSNFEQYRLQFNGKDNLLLFKELIGFVNPQYEEKFLNFLKYEARYNASIKDIPTQKQKLVRIDNMNGCSKT